MLPSYNAVYLFTCRLFNYFNIFITTYIPKLDQRYWISIGIYHKIHKFPNTHNHINTFESDVDFIICYMNMSRIRGSPSLPRHTSWGQVIIPSYMCEGSFIIRHLIECLTCMLVLRFNLKANVCDAVSVNSFQFNNLRIFISFEQ